MKEKMTDLIEITFQRDGSLYVDCTDINALFTSEEHKWYTLWSCQKVCEALNILLYNIYMRFGTKLYRQIVGIPMGTNCASRVAILFLFCNERDFMMFPSADKDAELIEAFNATSRYLDDVLNVDIPILTVWSIKFTHQKFN